MKGKILLAMLTCLGWSVQAQELAYARYIVDTLTSPFFWGRGYTNDGVHKAASFLETQYRQIGLIPLDGKSFQQKYHFSVNTFPSQMSLSINDHELIPGKDFIVSPESKGLKAKGNLSKRDSIRWIDYDRRVGIFLVDKLTWSVAKEAADYTQIEVLKSSLSEEPQSYHIDVESKWQKKFESANICGMVKGLEVPDSFIVFSAHYDHLGGMGKNTYFPGANDNASGVSLLLNLAKYFSAHPSRYTMVFILFSGEEIGLLGSEYFVQNPLIDLEKIRFLLNTDLAGTGEEGITVVNATEFPKEFELMKTLNEKGSYLKSIVSRGKAKNSDHYHFTEKGVPSFFFYTMGGVGYYHDINDRAETLPLNEHEDLFHLLVDFCSELSR